jgi:hypothetical protein
MAHGPGETDFAKLPFLPAALTEDSQTSSQSTLTRAFPDIGVLLCFSVAKAELLVIGELISLHRLNIKTFLLSLRRVFAHVRICRCVEVTFKCTRKSYVA